jgi:hypothetical protein
MVIIIVIITIIILLLSIIIQLTFIYALSNELRPLMKQELLHKFNKHTHIHSFDIPEDRT